MKTEKHTIYAVATAPVKSGVAIVRISGVKAQRCLELLTHKSSHVPRFVQLSKIYDPDSKMLIDEGLAVYFKAPNSFTGEDVVELHVHGSRAVICSLLSSLERMQDVRPAEPGEFSMRAFENGKMDLTEAEGLSDLIDAETSMQLHQALKQKHGHLKELYDKWRSFLIKILANIEAYIDFPDEDIPDDTAAEVQKSIDELVSSIKEHLDDGHKGEKLRNGLHAVIIGAPNVGKSSLINCLAKRDVAIVSDIPGTTRDAINVSLDLGGYPITLSDTAGLRDSDDILEKEGIRRTINTVGEADLVIAVFDVCKLPHIEKETLELLSDDALVLLNKCDLNSKFATPKPLKEFKNIAISTKTKMGIDIFIKELENYAMKQLSLTEDPLITRSRHRLLLQEAVDSLALFNLANPLEISTEHLRRAALSLGRITGVIGIEDVLDDIFSNFCIGK